MFKTIIISYSTRIGGAGIAANNFKQLLSDDIAISQVRVISQDQSGDISSLQKIDIIHFIKVSV